MPAGKHVRRTVSWLTAGAAALLVATTSGCGADATAAESSTVTVMTWAPLGSAAGSEPGLPALAQATAEWINDNGGLNGRQLRVLTCDEHNTAAGAQDCANEAVQHNVAAVVGSYSQYGDSFMPLLNQAGIPYIGGAGLSDTEFSAPYSYPVNGGYQSLLAGNGSQLVASGCRRVAVVRPASIVGDTMVGFLDAGLAGHGLKALDIKVTPGRTDYTSAAVEAIGPDSAKNCVSTALDAASTSTFLDSYRRLSHRRTRLASVVGSFQQTVVDATGGSSGPLANALVTSWYPPDDSPVWNDLHAVLKKYAFTHSEISSSDPFVETTWVAYQVLRTAAAGIQGPITATSLHAQLETTGGITVKGITPALNWQMQNMLPDASVPRTVNTDVTFQHVSANGELTWERKGLIDMRPALNASALNN